MLIIKPVDPARTEVIGLIEQLDDYQSSLYPPESNHLDPLDELVKSNTYFLAAYSSSEICGPDILKNIINLNVFLGSLFSGIFNGSRTEVYSSTTMSKFGQSVRVKPGSTG